ncbi:MAG: hypothetical protein ACRYFU_09345 [Janthinobacterium lividum]
MIQAELNPAIRTLAERLLALEKDAPIVAEEDLLATCRVWEKLRRRLSYLVGSVGVNTLMQRALTLAKRECPALSGVQTMDDGSLAGLQGDAAQASSMLVAHLIQLLVTFIGESLTLRLLRGTWPEIKNLDEFTGKGSYEQ